MQSVNIPGMQVRAVRRTGLNLPVNRVLRAIAVGKHPGDAGQGCEENRLKSPCEQLTVLMAEMRLVEPNSGDLLIRFYHFYGK